LRVDLDQAFTAFDRHAHLGAFLVDQLDLGGEADELDAVPGEREFRAQQRTVRGAQNENVVFGFCHGEMCPSVEQKNEAGARFRIVEMRSAAYLDAMQFAGVAQLCIAALLICLPFPDDDRREWRIVSGEWCVVSGPILEWRRHRLKSLTANRLRIAKKLGAVHQARKEPVAPPRVFGPGAQSLRSCSSSSALSGIFPGS